MSTHLPWYTRSQTRLLESMTPVWYGLRTGARPCHDAMVSSGAHSFAYCSLSSTLMERKGDRQDGRPVGGQEVTALWTLGGQFGGQRAPGSSSRRLCPLGSHQLTSIEALNRPSVRFAGGLARIPPGPEGFCTREGAYPRRHRLMKTASGPMERWYPMEVLAPERGTATLGSSFLEVGENRQGAGSAVLHPHELLPVPPGPHRHPSCPPLTPRPH